MHFLSPQCQYRSNIYVPPSNRKCKPVLAWRNSKKYYVSMFFICNINVIIKANIFNPHFQIVFPENSFGIGILHNYSKVMDSPNLKFVTNHSQRREKIFISRTPLLPPSEPCFTHFMMSILLQFLEKSSLNCVSPAALPKNLHVLCYHHPFEKHYMHLIKLSKELKNGIKIFWVIDQNIILTVLIYNLNTA